MHSDPASHTLNRFHGLGNTISYAISTGTKLRARRPCDPCRRRKSRCEVQDGNLPCLLCRFHNQECTFNEDPQPRKRRAVAINDDFELNEKNQARTSCVPQDKRNNTGPSLSPQDALVKIRKDQPIDDYANIRGPSLLKQTLGLQTNRHSRLIGSTAEYEHLLLDLGPTNDIAVSAGQPILRRVNSTLNHQKDIPDLDAIETIVAPYGSALIHLYFRIVHPSFPILHKKVFLEKYERTHREFSPPLLAAVYLLALNWWSYSGELALLPKPDVSRLEELALASLGNIIHRPKLSTIQAGLLLLQRPEGDSWALTCQLVGLGQDMGLHLDCTNWRIPVWERGLRKRLAWAMFMQDKWGALVHGRPSHITPNDWDTQPLQEDDFPENAADEDEEDGSTEVEKGRILFCYMVKLTLILSGILSTFYTLKAEREWASRAHEGVRSLLDAAKPLQLELRQWYADLPSTLKMQDIGPRKLSSVGYLHLGYYVAEMTLHRRIIRSLSSVDEPQLRTICRQAAQTRLTSAMTFVQSLRPEHLQSFWYSASTYNFVLIGSFVSLLWVTSTDREEAAIYRAELDEYRWMLRLSSKSADLLQRALVSLNTSTGALVKAIPVDPDPNVTLRAYQLEPRRMASLGTDLGRIESTTEFDGNVVSTVAYSGGSPLEENGVPDHSWFHALGVSSFDSGYGLDVHSNLGFSTRLDGR
ncbi:nitrogen regulatory protein OTam [Decorospora gaudefroyi]|uniref:Nitrogen regulatory protein OTam n=1 Tax=Decorospora gaudefroyi TaxID=184978 RepID=A0A6A5K8T2_9PLEO|nr:nitrogen regulatory protein OTam [Decorospora gaudefroyi]